MTRIINLFGAPGTGKSTTAADLFAIMKKKGYSVELVREYAKDLTWEGSSKLTNQLHIAAEQNDRVYNLLGRVDWIVTDSPLLLANVYNTGTDKASALLRDLVAEIHHKDESINILLNRVKKFNPAGRNQTEEEADALAWDIRKLLSRHEPHQYYEWPCTPDVAKNIFKVIVAEATFDEVPRKISSPQ